MTGVATTLEYFPAVAIVAPLTEKKAPYAFEERAQDYGLVATTYHCREFAPHFSKLARLSFDRVLWFSPDTPPSDISRNAAGRLLQMLEEKFLVPSRIVATAEGGIAISFVDGEKYADIESTNVGLILGVVSNRKSGTGGASAWEIDPSPAGISEAFDRVQNFFHPS